MKRITFNLLINVIVISAVFIPRFSVAQETKTTSAEPKMCSNAIYGSVGIGGLYFPATIYYERMLKQNMWNRGISSFAKVGIGTAAHWEGHSEYFLGQYGMLTGREKNHFEASIGFVYFYRGDMYSGSRTTSTTININEDGTYNIIEEKTSVSALSLLSGSIGYRYQKPKGHLVFRTGIGWPEAVYVSLGFSLFK